jgi:hypothetical protein
MVEAQGYYRQGEGGAARNLDTQIPAIVDGGFPEIRDYYRGTINVQFVPMIIAAGYDHRTAPIRWKDTQPRGEVFDLVRVRLRLTELNMQVRALLYISHWTIYRHHPHIHEFVAERFIEGLRPGMSVLMECDRDRIILPYESRGTLAGKPIVAETIVIL